MRTTWAAAILGIGLMTAAAATTTAQAPAKITVEQHEGYMKSIASTNAALGKKVESKDLAGAAADAKQLATLLGDVEKFWAQYNKADGVKWAQDGRSNATSLAGALSGGDTAKVAELRKAVSGSCGGCHTAYREGNPKEGGYRLKAGVATE